MKMSEMFKSELAEVPHNPSFEPFDIKYYSYGELRECSAEQETAVQHAVLTHDSNIERIKELEEALQSFVNDVQLIYISNNTQSLTGFERLMMSSAHAKELLDD